jgi:hypothetical protein
MGGGGGGIIFLFLSSDFLVVSMDKWEMRVLLLVITLLCVIAIIVIIAIIANSAINNVMFVSIIIPPMIFPASPAFRTHPFGVRDFSFGSYSYRPMHPYGVHFKTYLF